jgi:hypothetical protein
MNQARFETYPQRETVSIAAFQDSPEEARTVPGALNGQYGWRFRAANGEIDAVGGEGFTRREDARRAARGFVYTVIRLLLGQQVGLSMDNLIPLVDLDEDDVVIPDPTKPLLLGERGPEHLAPPETP